jgi:hypothetical protein
MSLPKRFEVKTNYSLNSFQKGVVIFMFVLGLVSIPVGGFLFMLFSLAMWFFPGYMSKKYPVALILTHEGIEHIAFNNKLVCFLPWKDIDGFCSLVAKQNGFIVITRYVGVRLKRYEGYLDSVASRVSPETSSSKLYKFMSSQSENVMLWTRKKYGCEFIFMQNFLDRSIPEFINLLEEYHKAFG